MALSMYEISAPVYRQFLTSLHGVIEKAEGHCAANAIDPKTLIDARLFDDMQPLSFQVAQAAAHSAGALGLIAGKASVSQPLPDSFPALKQRINDAVAALDAIKPADLEGAETREVTLKLGQREMKFTGLNYLQSFAMPQFFFHATTAYDILRNRGVSVGKRDFMGHVKTAA